MIFECPQQLTWTDILHRAMRHPLPTESHTDFATYSDDLSSDLDDELRTAWMQSLGSAEPEKLQKRLLWAGIDASVVATLICQARAHRQYQAISDPLLHNLSDAMRAAANQPLCAQGLAGMAVLGTEQLAFIDMWVPAAAWALRELCAALHDQLDLHVETSCWEELAARLLSRLCHIAEMTLWEKFNEERSPGIMLLAHLGENGDGTGQPTRDYYRRFIQRHRSDGLASLLAAFPVLGRLISTVTALWLDSTAAMLRRIDADRADLARIFAIPLHARLAHVQQGVSDPHCGGRNVAILTFVDADVTHRVVYKPKDIRVDAAYQHFIACLNTLSDLPALQSLRVLPAHGYGYMEFIPHRLCTHANELSQFYYNAGRHTAILYVLGCTDCHHENLIANGAQWLLVDGETLFEADFTHPAEQYASIPSASPVGELQRHIDDSVLRSGLLPMWQYFGQHKFATDLSALGIASPRTAVEEGSGWLGLNSDGMMPGLIDVPCKLPTSLPVGVGESNPLHAHVERFCDGFQAQCKVLMRHRSNMLGENGLLSAFQGLQRRILKRDTWIYYAIQSQLLAPDALRSEVAQGLRLEQMGRAFLVAAQRPTDWPVFEAEMRQMERLDIPFFVHPIDGMDMGEMGSLAGLMKTNGLEACRQRLQALDPDGIAFQLRLIRGAVQARVLRADQRQSAHRTSAFVQEVGTGTVPAPAVSPLHRGITPESRLAVSQTIAKQLLDLAFHDDVGRCEWLGMNIGWGGLRYYFGPVGPSLYSGSTGIALFFACLQQALQSSAALHRDLALDTLIQEIMQPLAQLPQMGDGVLMRWWRDQPLGLAGCGGVLLALLTLDRLALPAPKGLESYTGLAHKLLQGLHADRLETDQELDLLHGITGLIGPLLMLGDVHALQLAGIAGNRLVDQQQAAGGWLIPSAQRPLTGWSHGAAGMAAALAQLAHHTGERRYLQAAAQGLAYERQVFDAKVGNWPDFRSPQESPYFHMGWCNGAPGMALSRLCLQDTDLWNRQTEEELATATATTAHASLRPDHLCCGRFGLVAILRMVAAGKGAYGRQAEAAAARIEYQALQEAEARGGHFHLLGSEEGSMIQPGLMTGVSGIGMVLLHEPHSLATLQMILSGGLWPTSFSTQEDK